MAQLDPSIITNIRAPQIPSVAQQESQAAQLRRQFLEQHVASYRLQKEQRDAQELDAIQQIVAKHGDIEEALPEIKRTFPMKGLALEKEIAELKGGQQAGFTLSPGQSRYDAQGKLLAEGPSAPAAQAGFTLSPGQSRYDAQGQSIASMPANPAANSVNAGSFEDYVLRYAAEKGKQPNQVTVDEIRKLRKDYQQADDRPINISTPRPLTQTAESQLIRQLNSQWTAATKPAVEMDRQVAIMDEGIKAARSGNLNAGGQAVLVTFQKILDPNSVVRESEFDRSREGQALMQRAKGIFERLTVGGPGVPLAELEKYAAVAKQIAKAQRSSRTSAIKDRIGKNADRYNIPRDLIFESDATTMTALPPPAQPSASGGVTVTAPNGKSYTFPNQAQADAFKKKAGIP